MCRISAILLYGHLRIGECVIGLISEFLPRIPGLTVIAGNFYGSSVTKTLPVSINKVLRFAFDENGVIYIPAIVVFDFIIGTRIWISCPHFSFCLATDRIQRVPKKIC